MFYSPAFLVIMTVISALRSPVTARTRYERTMYLRRRVRRGAFVHVATIDGVPVPVIP